MAIPSRQIGRDTEENLLWQISKQLEMLTGVFYSISSNNTTTSTTTTTSLPYSVAQLGFAIPDDGAGAACINALNPSTQVTIYWAPGVSVQAGVTFLYTDPALTVTAESGYYSTGSEYYAVNIYGLVQVVDVCP